MARIRMVTRTVTTTVVVVMCADTNTAKCENYEYEIAGTFTDDKTLIEAIKKVSEDNIVPVAVITKTEKDVLYGMPESDFIRMAKVLPPRSGNDEE